MAGVDLGLTFKSAAGPFWSPPIAVDVAELNPSLLAQIEDRDDKRGFRAYVVQVFADHAGPPEGMFEIAFNRKGKRACAIFEAIPDDGRHRAVVASSPVWVTANSPHSAVGAAFEAFVERSAD
ncbi:hypothetical protein ACIQUG_21565 [Ensifer sp. NPDC090286]|uniref:hypothetical protein n=1 Tax=Ensifer sp. NPDC090286 TaxID=3363991 RepID=UPI00383A3C0C